MDIKEQEAYRYIQFQTKEQNIMELMTNIINGQIE